MLSGGPVVDDGPPRAVPAPTEVEASQ
jgi:hypothetical protein